MKVKLTSCLPESLDPRTLAFRYSEPTLMLWLGYTMCWKWDGGDAITVTVGKVIEGNVRSLCAFRVGDHITLADVSDCGIEGRLRAEGMEIDRS